MPKEKNNQEKERRLIEISDIAEYNCLDHSRGNIVKLAKRFIEEHTSIRDELAYLFENTTEEEREKIDIEVMEEKLARLNELDELLFEVGTKLQLQHNADRYVARYTEKAYKSSQYGRVSQTKKV